MRKTYFNWSSGKDSAMALHYLKQDKNLEISKLLTTVNGHHDRVSMHGIRRELLHRQFEALGIPATTIELPELPSMEEYESIMFKTVQQLKDDGYADCGFGDIFLEDLRAYREKQLKGIQCHFPLWGKNTTQLLEDFIDMGFKAIVVCINGDLLDSSFIGRELDRSFLNDLPKNVDPCGENGEYHTFCYDGPIYSAPVPFTVGEKTLREYKKSAGEVHEHPPYWFLDLK